jgi:NAD-dependent dihydropyrimidine dehydrogenase PreA subunit
VEGKEVLIMADIKTWESEEIGCSISIDHELCNGDGECVEVCPTEVYEIVDGKSTAANIDECIECCACVEACPTDAIEHSTC